VGRNAIIKQGGKAGVKELGSVVVIGAKKEEPDVEKQIKEN